MENLLTQIPFNQKWFKSFRKTDEFAEALAIVWRTGTCRDNGFLVTHKKQSVITRFTELVGGNVCSRFRKDKNYTEWYCWLNIKHPFIQEIIRMGWAPIKKQARLYPVGEFSEEVFVKTFILMRHDLGTMREKTKKGILIRPRLRIHGSIDMLDNIFRVLHQSTNIKKKRLQTDTKVERAKTIYFQSPKEIIAILEYVGALESLEKYHSFDLGYQDE